MSKHMTVDLSDPRVRDLLGVTSPAYAGKQREVIQLAGDAPDPTGLTAHHGLQSTHFLTGGKQEIVVIFGDQIMTLDLYALPGEPMRVQIICPRCHKHSTIREDQKHIEYEPTVLNPARSAILEVLRGAPDGAPDLVRLAGFGRLSIETFECAWEIGESKHVAGAVRTGTSLCRLRLVIDNNRAREV